MATEQELRDLRKDVAQWQNSSNKLLKQYIDYREDMRHVHPFFRKQVKALRDFNRRMKKRRRKLTKRIREQRRNKGPNAALKYAHSKVGTTESPPGSNDGGLVRKWWTWLGYRFPVPWCGCFAGFAVIKKGGAAILSKLRLGYTPYIVEDANAHRNGLRAVPATECRKGDLVVFHFGSGGAKHVGVATGPVINNNVTTIDGNTSNGSGSQSDGGGVFKRTRPTWQVICYARPDW